MKKLAVFILFQLFICTLNAQSVTIQCNTPNCFFTDPEPFQTTYFANVVANGKTVQGYNWTISPNNAVLFTPSNGNALYTVNWLNATNNPVRTIKVKVTFTNNTSVESATQNVTIKHIAPITSMTITGGSPSTITTSGSTV